MSPFIYCVVCGCPFDIPPNDNYGFDDEESWATEDPSQDPNKQVSYRPPNLITAHNPRSIPLPWVGRQVKALTLEDPT